MNKNIIFTSLLMAIFSLAFIFMPAKPVFAASVTVSPDDGEVGSLTRVTGTGFTASVSYTIFFAYDTQHEEFTSGTVAVDGSISRSITVPEIPGGSYTVRVETASESASDDFTVTPELDLNKSSVMVGERVTIYGTGFRASRRVTIRFDSRTIATDTTNSRGSFSKTFNVPEADHGSHEVSADDNIHDLSARLTVEQSIDINPDSGPTGSRVTVTGTGFRDEREITITFDGDEVDTTPSSVTSDDDGSFTASFLVPTCLNRNPEVVASDGRYTDTARFTILASISLDPSSGKVGDMVNITGNGFRSNRLITLTLDGEEINARQVSIRSDGTGCFDSAFTVPASTSGVHQVRASDGTEDAMNSFTTLSAISLSPSSGPINAEITVTGTGFGSDRVVTIRFAEEHVRTTGTDAKGSFRDQFVVPQTKSGNHNITAGDGLTSTSAVYTVTTSSEVIPVAGHVGTIITVTGTGFTGAVTIQYDDLVIATTTADANGAFSISFRAPVSRGGHHTVAVSDSMNAIQATFTMESDAPPVPTLLLPEGGVRQNSRPSFSWGSVTDPSGVTYTLQIATDGSFNTLLLNKQGLTQPQYKLTREEGLESTDREVPYYWRVMAVDGASNDSSWTTPRPFFVNFLPQWAIYVIIVAASVLVSVLISRMVWRKRS